VAASKHIGKILPVPEGPPGPWQQV